MRELPLAQENSTASEARFTGLPSRLEAEGGGPPQLPSGFPPLLAPLTEQKSCFHVTMVTIYLRTLTPGSKLTGLAGQRY